MSKFSMGCKTEEYICKECGFIGNDKLSCKHSQQNQFVINNKKIIEIIDNIQFLNLSIVDKPIDPKCVIKEIINVKKES